MPRLLSPLRRCSLAPPLVRCPPPPTAGWAQEGSVFRGTVDCEAQPFDWGEGYRRPNLPLKDLVIAELPVRLFTGGCMCSWSELC